MNDDRLFPIQEEWDRKGIAPATTIPWWLAEIAYEQYAKLFGTNQSLERLAERGGFGRRELVILLRQKNPYDKLGAKRWERPEKTSGRCATSQR